MDLSAILSWRPGRRHQSDDSRWVVVDVETSGLDPERDQLLAIAGIALRVDWATGRLEIHPGDSFEVVLRQASASARANILLHGIGAQKQRDGLAPDLAMQAFAAFVGHSPLLAFHAAFDQTLINRFSRAHLGGKLPNPWIDIEHLCAVTHSHQSARTLDDWMAVFGVSCAVRHQAVADTLAECEVLLRIWPRLVSECSNWHDMARVAARQRWITRP